MKIIVTFLAIFLNFSYCFAGIKQGPAIKGITPVDVYLNLTKKGFKTRWNQHYKEYNHWLLEESSTSN
ncbi:hypothetical protein N9C35_03490 [Flavobacteriaceae bacterium]|nr:hypothetical protein [Flavobacteriaceae bacterium]